MALFRRVLGTFLTVFALSSPVLAQQGAAVPCNLLRSEEQRRAGAEALRVRQYATARSAYEEALKACPDQRGILLELSRVDLHLRDYPEAIRAAQRYVDSDAGSVEGRLALANAYFMAQQPKEALREAETVLRTDPAQAAALKLKGNAEYLTGRRGDAVATFVTLLEHHPEDEEGAYMLGRIYFEEGHIEHATAQFERVLRIDPKHYKAYDNLGLCYEAQGKTDLAKRYFLTAIRLVDKDHPEYDWPYGNLANLLLDEGDAETAFAFASKAANRNAYSARNFYLGGSALAKLGKNEQCVKWLERAAALDPHYQEPLYLLTRVYTQLGQEEKARAARERLGALKSGQTEQPK